MATQEKFKKFTIVDLKKIYQQNQIPYKKTGVKKQDYIKKLVQQQKKGVVVRIPKQLDQRLKEKRKPIKAPSVVPAPAIATSSVPVPEISERLTDHNCKKTLKEDLQKALRTVHRPFTTKDKKDVLCDKLKDYFREKAKQRTTPPPQHEVVPKSAGKPLEPIPYKSCKDITVKELVPLLKKLGITSFTSKTKKADLCKLIETQIQRRKGLAPVIPLVPPTPPRSLKPKTPPPTLKPKTPTPPRTSSKKTPHPSLPTVFGDLPPTQEETVQQIIEKVKKCIRESTV